MMNWMINKRNQKGFTLMEMLIVVAIIAILVAVSIPVFTSQLEKARNATDLANERAAKACGVIAYLSDDASGAKYYDAAAGTLVDTKPAVGYGKSTAAVPGGATTTVPKDLVLKVTVATDGTVTLAWE